MNDYPSLCISDRDSIYGHWLEVMLKDYYGTKLIHIPLRQPWKNGRVERFHRSLKEEAFLNFIPITEDQVQRRCFKYKRYYNEFRCHQTNLDQKPNDKKTASASLIPNFNVIARLREL